MLGAMKRCWIPLLLTVVVLVGAYAVISVRKSTLTTQNSAEGSGITANFNPKSITYDVTGSGGTVSIDYLDENGQPHLVEHAALPWSFTIVTTLPSMSANVIAQGDRDVGDLKCRVTVDADVRDDRASTDAVKPFIYCLVKSV